MKYHHLSNFYNVFHIITDGTSFRFNIQTEKNGARYCYDGFDSNGQNIAVQIKGQPIYTDDNDTYWNFNNDSGATNPPPPQILCCRDTYSLQVLMDYSTSNVILQLIPMIFKVNVFD